MDIFRFVNSKDIRGHLRDIGYEFNSLEAAWLIYQCHDATIDEKHTELAEDPAEVRSPWTRFAIGRLMTSFSAFRVRGKMKCSDESPKGCFEAFVDQK